MEEFLEPVTVGKEFYGGYRLCLYYDCNGSTLKDTGNFESYGIIYVKEGIGYISVGDLKVFVCAPCICCFNEKELSHLLLDPGLKCDVLYFHPLIINSTFNYDVLTDEFVNSVQDAYLLKPFIGHGDSFRGIIKIDHSVSKRISSLITEAGRELNCQRDTFWPCRSRAILLELLVLTGRLYDKHSAGEDFILNNSNGDISDLLTYLHTNYYNRITISELTRKYHVNRTTLNTKFKEVTGCSIIEYLNYVRIQVACSMLRNTSLPVYDIYLRVGFKGDTNFVRMFKKHIKCSPSEYRQNNCCVIY